MPMPPLTLTVREAAAMLGVGMYTVKWMIEEGMISFVETPERKKRRVSLVSVWHYLGARSEEVSLVLAQYSGLGSNNDPPNHPSR